MIAALIFAQLVMSHVRVLDGDTFRYRSIDYRLGGIDTPETGGRAECEAEAALGARARVRVAELIAGGAVVIVTPTHDPRGRRRWPRDGFGRRLARVSIDGVDLGTQLVGEGLAAPWAGPPAAKPDWCATPQSE